MSVRVELTLFSHVAARPDPQVDLAQASLLIGEGEIPGLDTGKYMRIIDSLGRQAAEEIERATSHSGEDGSILRPIDHLLRWMFEEAGFHGNTIETYLTSRNSSSVRVAPCTITPFSARTANCRLDVELKSASVSSAQTNDPLCWALAFRPAARA